MSTLVSVSPASTSAGLFNSRAFPVRRTVLRGGLVLGSIAAALVANSVSNPGALTGVEHPLVVLLRGMAVLKGAAALAAMGLAAWRFGRPVSSEAALGYGVGVWSLVAASVLIWNLSAILVAAAIFHVGLFGLLLLAWREGLAEWRPLGAARTA